MHLKAFSAAVFEIDVYLVEVEVGSGKDGDLNVVGLPDIAVKECRERISPRSQSTRYIIIPK